jgi:broad specificity phosphatase PhoE
MATLTLVRHGRPAIDTGQPANRWPLAPDAHDEVRALAPVGAPDARWYSSPEPKALGTARLLTDAPVAVVDDLREAGRTAVWVPERDDFHALLRRCFDRPDKPGLAGWEPLARARHRVAAAARSLLVPGADVVLVGHGTAWTLLVAELTGGPPDLEAWATMPMPAVLDLEVRADGSATVRRTWRT